MRDGSKLRMVLGVRARSIKPQNVLSMMLLLLQPMLHNLPIAAQRLAVLFHHRRRTIR